MNEFTDKIVYVNFKSLYDISFGEAMFLSIHALNQSDILKTIRTRNEINDIAIAFFQDTKNLRCECGVKGVVENLFTKLIPTGGIILSNVPSNFRQFEPTEDQLKVNINNLKFFLNNVWPLLVINIIRNRITIDQYVNNKRITRFSISEGVIAKKYPPGIDKEKACEMFVIDLKKWLNYNIFNIRDIDVKVRDGSKVIFITI